MACGSQLDPARQAEYDRARALWATTYGAADGRRRWWDDGEAQRYLDELAAAVRRVAPEYGLPPSPTDLMVVAHGAYSSGYGRSVMTQLAHNTWGIKCGASWTGPVLETASTDWDPASGSLVAGRSAWRVFAGWDAAVRNYFDKVMHEKRYQGSARALRAGSLDYMTQLGRDGWYGSPPAEPSRIWIGVMKRIAPLIGVKTLAPSRGQKIVAGAILAGVIAALVRE